MCAFVCMGACVSLCTYCVVCLCIFIKYVQYLNISEVLLDILLFVRMYVYCHRLKLLI